MLNLDMSISPSLLLEVFKCLAISIHMQYFLVLKLYDIYIKVISYIGFYMNGFNVGSINHLLQPHWMIPT